MKIRIDLKIIIFITIFWFTHQLKIYFIIMIFCFLHELGHIFIGIILGMKPEKIEILPCGFSSSFLERTDYNNVKLYENDSKNLNYEIKEMIIALAGPVVSLILAIILQYIDIEYITREEAVYSNILILILNLLPVYPLDGGRILKCILHIKYKIEKADKVTHKISYVTIIILTIISSIAVYYFKNVAIFLVCIFLWQKGLIFCRENSKI